MPTEDRPKLKFPPSQGDGERRVPQTDVPEEHVTLPHERRAAADADAPTIAPGPQAKSLRHDLSDNDLTTARNWSPEDVELPGYEIFGEVGRGGMGVVYKARHVNLNRLVAVKMVLAGQHAGSTDLVRFLAEAEAVAALQHPNIVQVYDLGQHQGLPYMALEFIDGGNLAQKLSGTPLPPHDAARLVEELARGMQAAHERGIFHRDLKPANVLLAVATGGSPVAASDEKGAARHYDWVPKITDFGLAKRVEGGTGLTQTGVIMGTPSYMAPEQASGDGKQVGPPADIYSLGAILYECLTGRPPFKAATPLDTIMQVVNEEPVPPAQLQSKLPRDLETICLKCLHKEAEKRYATAGQLADDLQRFLNDEPIRARRTGTLERGWRWCRRNPVVAAMTATLALLLTVIAAGSGLAAVLLNNERLVAKANEAKATTNANRAEKNLQRALTAEKEKTDKLWQSYLDQARALRWSGKAGQRFGALEAIRKAAEIRPSLVLRDEAIACMALVDLRIIKQWEGMPEGTHLSYDSKLKFYARSYPKGEVSIRRIEDDREIVRLPTLGVRRGPMNQFSPNGRYLATNYQKGQALTMAVWDIHQRKVVLEVPIRVHHNALCLSPDSRLIALGRADGSIDVHEILSGRRVFHVVSAGDPYAIEFDPMAKKIAVSCFSRKLVQVADLANGAILQSLAHPGRVRYLAWHPDGKTLAVACEGSGIHLWNADDGKLKKVLKKGGVTTHVRFSHGGDLLASDGWDGTLRIWDPITGEQLVNTEGNVQQFGFGGRIVSHLGAGKLTILQVASAHECHRLGLRSGWNASFSCDGRYLASATDTGVYVFALDSGKEVAWLPNGRSVVFAPNGKNMVASGPRGVHRWPITMERKKRNTILTLGPPSRALSRGVDFGAISLSNDGRTLAFRHQSHAHVLDSNRNKQIFLKGHTNMANISVSPSGNWVATGTWHGTGVKVWNASTGKLAVDLPVKGSANVRFSPDGKWLLTSNDKEYRFWECAAWKSHHIIDRPQKSNIAGSMAFSPDGRVVALNITRHEVELYETSTFGRLCKLVAGSQQVLSLSPDGTQLAVNGGTGEGRAQNLLRVWDLRAVRRQLKVLGLDWDLPDYPPPPKWDTSKPLVVKVLGVKADGPPVIALAPTRKQRQATPKEITGWMKQLADKDAKLRKQAAKALDEVGPAALTALARAAGVGNVEVKRAAQKIFDRIQLRQAFTPRLIHLQIKDATLTETVRALSKQSGIPVRYSPPTDPATLEQIKPLSLKWEGVPFWQALDELCRKSGLASVAFSQGLTLRHVAATKNAMIAYTGPFHLRATRVSYTSGLDVEKQPAPTGEYLIFSFHLKHHGPAGASCGPLRVLEAVDATGRALAPGPAASQAAFASLAPFFVRSLSVRVPAVGKPAGKLKRLKLGLTVDVPTPEIGQVIVPNVFTARGKTFAGAAGARVSIQRVTLRPGNRQVYLYVAVTGKDGWSYNPAVDRFELSDNNGKPYQSTSTPRLFARTFYQVRPEHIASLGGSPTAAFPGNLAWAALPQAVQRKPSRQWVGTVYFYTNNPKAAPATLRFSRFRKVRTELTFEFKDVPLP